MKQPNILLLVTDQWRGDCLGIEEHPFVQTPGLDYIASSGSHFTKAYTACPVCIPARRTLMSGQRPMTHGAVHNYNTELKGSTLAEELSKGGYQTHLCGKLHLWPERKHYGFHSMDWADGPGCSVQGGDADTDYTRYLRKEGAPGPRPQQGHGIPGNSWITRSWHLEERFHYTNWCTDMALDFLSRKDPTRPFFLKVSYFHPHGPLTPLQFYYDRYLNMDLEEPKVGDWVEKEEKPVRGTRLNMGGMQLGNKLALNSTQMKQYQAAYYASINHIDDQINRIMEVIPEDTVIVFVSDHGEMLGDHQMNGKCVAYEPSARVPFLVKLPESMKIAQQTQIDKPVELMDVMPTLLDVAGLSVPEEVEGKSVLPLIKGEATQWREFVHGEIARCPDKKEGQSSGMHYLTDGKRKYIWYPGLGEEQFFNLEEDPNEMKNLADEESYKKEVAEWRTRLVGELEHRPEGFVEKGDLRQLDGPTPSFISG